MTLPAFSAIIASYVPNTGNLGPSGSYNAWVNKINMRKNACNSWATCTKTPDDIWEVAFSWGDERRERMLCDEGCSGQNGDKCDNQFCDALADVYDYTRRLKSSDIKSYHTRLLSETAPCASANSGPYGNDVSFSTFIQSRARGSAGANVTLDSRYNEWAHHLRVAKQLGCIDESTLHQAFEECPNGCSYTKESGSKYRCGAGTGMFCLAMKDIFDTARYTSSGELATDYTEPANYGALAEEIAESDAVVNAKLTCGGLARRPKLYNDCITTNLEDELSADWVTLFHMALPEKLL